MKRKKEVAKFVGFRLYDRHRAIISRLARAHRISESEVVRRQLDAI